MYEKDGITYPRCTEIISDCTNKSDGLIQWAANQTVEWIRENCSAVYDVIGSSWDIDDITDLYVTQHDLDQARFNFRQTSQTALDVGSEVHAAIEAHLKGMSFTVTTKQAQTAFGAFIGWKKKVYLTPMFLERTVWGERWAGTLDFFGYYKGKLYVIDWKTSKAFYPEMRYQVAAYRSVIPDEVEGCGVLMLDKETGMPKFKDTSKTYESDLAVFNKMVELYYLRHPKIRKRFEGGE